MVGEQVQAGGSIFEEDYWALRGVLTELLEGANARSVLLVDGTGQVITSLATPAEFDVMSFAALCAADFEANRQLAHLIGEEDFSTLYHQGTNESMYLSRVEARVILAVLFDRRATLGLVRLRVARAVERLTVVFQRLFEKAQHHVQVARLEVDADFTARAEAQIDDLFQE
ncbi:MAG TPA: roadblock/LC7 domain-containing protein [Candidatus Krumholzibacteria bacterium]|nr:roadblock/LC7 domain-containing protein [Candidatus Krumholzibacteria bacterium]